MKTKRNLIQICLLGAALLTAWTSQAQLTVTKIAAGGYFNLFLKSDGSLWSMGNNDEGQLGDGTTNSIDEPEMIVASNVTDIAAGAYHALFLKNDGSLWVMGYGELGQLGDGLTNNILDPEPIVLSGVTAISAGIYHSLFLKSDGSLWAMGYNQDGELGDGTYTNNVFHEEIVMSGVTAISAGNWHSLFIKKHGSVGHVTTELWAMGLNSSGQLGDGSYNNTNKPEMILSYTAPAVGSPVTAIAAGGNHSLYLKSDGSLWVTGAGNFGQLGDGITNATRDVPEEIVASGVTAIAAGYYNSLFIRQGGLWAMGNDDFGQLGDDTTNNSVDLPELIFGPSPALGITTYGNQPMVFYPAGLGINHVLQMTTNLASPNWVTVTNSVPCTAALITNAPSNAFFRLQ